MKFHRILDKLRKCFALRLPKGLWAFWERVWDVTTRAQEPLGSLQDVGFKGFGLRVYRDLGG